jgi:hypothetical protein
MIKRTIFLVSTAAALVYGQKHPNWTRLIVQTHSRASDDRVNAAFTAHSASVRHRIERGRMAVLEVPARAAAPIKASLERTGLFTFVETDQLAEGAAIPNDPSYASQWHLARIQAPAAWDMTAGISGAPIAVIDSGVDATHPDLASRLIGGWSYLTGTSNTADVLGHGTAVAGTLGAATNNFTGVAGITWSNPVLPIAVLNSSNYASYADMASAIYYAADHGARVINISIGGSSSSSALQSAVNYAWGKGAVVFAAAMNNGSTTPYYPAACDKAVAVSSTNSADSLSGFSNRGAWIDISAPGESILTTSRGGGYGYWSGTSFASPVAAGVAALVLALRPSLTAAELVNLMEANSDDLGIGGFDASFGWGRINAYKAVLAAKNIVPDTSAPSVVVSSPASGVTVSGTVAVEGAAADNIGVTRVEFFVDGVLVSSGAASAFSFSWNSASVANGAHTLAVKGFDAAGNSGLASVTLAVNNPVVVDTQAPTVAITRPGNGSIVTGNVLVAVTAVDNTAITQVSIYIDGVLQRSMGTAPYSFNWNTKKTAAGLHTITAKAWDAASNQASATPVTVTKR